MKVSLQQFAIECYSLPYRFDRNANGGGVITYVREDIPCKELTTHSFSSHMEGIVLEINLRKTMCRVFGVYNNSKLNIDILLSKLGPILDQYMSKFDNFLLLGDFNSETHEIGMIEFCNIYNLQNLITDPTCFKNLVNPSLIDLILTNKPRSFQSSQVIETGLSDHHKMTIPVLRIFFQKQAPIRIRYQDYKRFDKSLFHTELGKTFRTMDYITYEICT